MKFYVAGPIMGMPENNIKAFQNAAGQISATGHEAVIPHDIQPRPHVGRCPRSYNPDMADGHSSACQLRADLIKMLRECDAVYMLGDWEYSQGARLEHSVATLAGLRIYYEFGKIPLPPVRSSAAPTECANEAEELAEGYHDAVIQAWYDGNRPENYYIWRWEEMPEDVKNMHIVAATIYLEGKNG